RNDVAFTRVANTHNQRAAASGVSSLTAGDAIYDSVVGKNAAQARTAFDALSGEFYASRLGALLDDSRYTREAVGGRLDHQCAGSDGDNASPIQQCAGSAWLHPYGNWGHTSGDGNAARLRHDVSGFYLGADKTLTSDVRIGFLAGYRHARDRVSERNSRGSDDSYQLGIYAGLTRGAFSLKAGVAHAWHDLDGKRRVEYADFNDLTRADYHARTTQIFAEGGY